MGNGLTEKKIIWLFLAFGLLLRLLLAFLPGFKIDIEAWFAWSMRLFENGLTQFYQAGYFADYPPGFLYILYLLGLIKQLFQIPDSAFLLILKLPSIIAEILIAFVSYKIVISAKRPIIWALAVFLGVLFNFGLIFNSSIWGQGDAFLTLLLIVTIYVLSTKKYRLASCLIAYSFLVKPQTIALFPIFGLFLLTKYNLKKTINLLLPGVGFLFILQLPFFLSNPFLGLFQLLGNTANQYNYTSLFAFNIWGIVGFWIDDRKSGLLLSYQNWGILLFGLYWIMVTVLYFKSKKKNLYLFSSLALLGFFFLPTKVHERYLYPAIPFLFLSAGLIKNKWLYIQTAVLSVIYTINLYYVYVYYNEFYYKMPKILYIPNLYESISDHLRLLSVVSSFLFIIICVTIVKHASD